jgi:hypothetical protein
MTLVTKNMPKKDSAALFRGSGYQAIHHSLQEIILDLPLKKNRAVSE